MLNMTIMPQIGTLNLSTLFCALFVFFCIYWDAWFFFKKYVVHSPCWIQSALRLFMFYTIFTSCIAMYRLSVTLRNYQPVAWVWYQRVIDQSKADIFIKPGIVWHITWTRPHYYINTHSIHRSFICNKYNITIIQIFFIIKK